MNIPSEQVCGFGAPKEDGEVHQFLKVVMFWTAAE